MVRKDWLKIFAIMVSGCATRLKRRIGHLYPKVTLPKEYGGGEATVIAWLMGTNSDLS